jgi:hypothetical protein
MIASPQGRSPNWCRAILGRVDNRKYIRFSSTRRRSPRGTIYPLVYSLQMPRYFFNVFHHQSEPDSVGEELPDKHAASARRLSPQERFLRDIDGKLQPGREWRMEVTDEFENQIFIIHVNAEKRNQRRSNYEASLPEVLFAFDASQLHSDKFGCANIGLSLV